MRLTLLAAIALQLLSLPSAADDAVQIEHLKNHPYGSDRVELQADQAPELQKCLFGGADAGSHQLSARDFALQCVVPYINGLWLDPSVLYRSKSNILAQARDNLILHSKGKPFPIFYPPVLAERVSRELQPALGRTNDVVLKPLPSPWIFVSRVSDRGLSLEYRPASSTPACNGMHPSPGRPFSTLPQMA